MPLDLQTHKTTRRRGGGSFVTENPYQLLVNGEERVYLQKGGVYDAAGKYIEEPPDWVWEAIDKIAEPRRKELSILTREEFDNLTGDPNAPAPEEGVEGGNPNPSGVGAKDGGALNSSRFDATKGTGDPYVPEDADDEDDDKA